MIILGCSMMLKISLFSNIKILVVIACLLLVNYSLWLALKFVVRNSVTDSIKDVINQAIKYITMMV